MSLDTLANVKSRLGISGSTDDTLLGQLMDSADRWIAEFTGRHFEGGTFTEYFPGNVTLLHLSNYPVTAITSVKVDPSQGFGAATVLATTSYVAHLERGVIQSKVGAFVAAAAGALVNADRDDWTRSPRAVQVVYTTATSNVPADVKEAYALLVGQWYRQVKTLQAANYLNLDQQRFGEALQTFQRSAPEGVSPDVTRLLMPHRTPNL
jgi:uncharacterized phiE125 gp8 family phage protein